MANQNLKDRYWNIPKKHLKHLSDIINSYDGSKREIGYVRINNAIQRGTISYPNMKVILGILQQLKNPANSSGKFRYNPKLYNLNGGEQMENWIKDCLETARKEIQNVKQSKKDAGQSNAFKKTHNRTHGNPNAKIHIPKVDNLTTKNIFSGNVNYESKLIDKSKLFENMYKNINEDEGDALSLPSLFKKLMRSPEEQRSLMYNLLKTYHGGKLDGYVKYYFGDLLGLVGNWTDFIGIKSINASSKGISELPEHIGDLEDLEELILEHNNIDVLPVSIGNLKKLKRLDLTYNNIGFLPESIGGCESLRELSLSNNQLKALPNTIGNLGELSSFAAHNNQIKELPRSITGLENLRNIWISNNQIRKFPDGFENIPHLSFVDVSENPMTNEYIEQVRNSFPYNVTIYYTKRAI